MILYFSATGNCKYCAEFLENLEFQNLSEEIYSYGGITCGSSSGKSAKNGRYINPNVKF